MKDFVYHNPTRIIFGKESEQQAGAAMKELGSTVLMVYGGGSIKKTGLYEKVMQSLKNSSVTCFELSGIKPNPVLSSVREGISLCRKHAIEAVLAVGGGSVIDAAKAIAFGAVYDGDVWDFFLGKEQVAETLPLGVVLTLPGTGSESSYSCVVTNEEGWFKRAVNIDTIRPKFAILNPELTYTLSPFQTVCGAFDAMTHVMERYFTATEQVYVTDRQCEAAMRSFIHLIPQVINTPRDYNARAELMWLSKIAHDDSLGVGRLGDYASHRIGHEISALFDVPHAATLSIMFPAWMRYVYRKNMKRFLQYSANVWNIEYAMDGEEESVLQGIEKTEQFLKAIGLPVRLSELDVKIDRLEEMAEKCTLSGPTGNMVPLNKDEVLTILNTAR